MIKIYLLGGIGNQLFQTSLAVGLNQELDVQIALDGKSLHNRSLGIDFLTLPEGLSISTGKAYSKTFHRFASRGLLPNIYNEKELQKFFLNHQLRPYLTSANLYGYFQSPYYFRNSENQVEKLFSNINMLSNVNPYIAIHIRGGDYLSYKKYYKLGVTYYVNAIKEAVQGSNMRIKVFTDDPFHANNIISEIKSKGIFKNDFELVTAERDPWITFSGLINAEVLIIANSTFSWWAGWLAGRHGKKVIRPSSYYAGNNQPKNLYPAAWLEVDVV